MTSHAEIKDKLTAYTATLTGVLSLIYITAASQFLVDGEISALLAIAEKVLAIIVILLCVAILPLAAKKTALKRHQANEGFLDDVARKSMTASWLATFLSLVALSILAKGSLSRLPAEFLLNVAAALLTASFALSFFYLNRVGETKASKRA